jgi:tRNA pseudouridine38-40 synthase
MVRAIVGTLLWVGHGKIDVAAFEKIIAASDRAMAGPSAPANGLCLVAVEYGERRARRELDEADE